METNRAGRGSPQRAILTLLRLRDAFVRLTGLASASPLQAGLPSRRLMDTFGDSLRFVNQLFTQAFGAVISWFCALALLPENDLLESATTKWPFML